MANVAKLNTIEIDGIKMAMSVHEVLEYLDRVEIQGVILSPVEREYLQIVYQAYREDRKAVIFLHDNNGKKDGYRFKITYMKSIATRDELQKINITLLSLTAK